MDTELKRQILAKLPHWTMVDGKLHRTFDFDNFVQAFNFMSQVAIVAEDMNHHPQWSNVYKTVVVDLITHSEGRITELDIQLAQKMDVISKDLYINRDA